MKTLITALAFAASFTLTVSLPSSSASTTGDCKDRCNETWRTCKSACEGSTKEIKENCEKICAANLRSCKRDCILENP